MRTWLLSRTTAVALMATPFLLEGGTLLRAAENGPYTLPTNPVPVSVSRDPGRTTGSEATKAPQASNPTGHDHAAHTHGTTAAPAPPSKDTPSPLVSWFAGGTGLYTPPYYDSFKGLDLASLTPVQRERFLHWVNTEFCTCSQTGCTRDTIANCYTNDPACPRAPVRIRQILEKVKSGSRPPGPAASAPAPQPPVPGR